jgi:ubiquinone/menaquinone biosynthesis C-methylase UbiE
MKTWLIILLLLVLFQNAVRRFIISTFPNFFEQSRQNWFRKVRIDQLISPDSKVLDFGSGFGSLRRRLLADGFDVTSLDVNGTWYIGNMNDIVLYDGKKIPFPDKTFDVAVVCTVMHHITDTESSLRELKRVCKKIIIVEDVPRDPLHALAIWTLDSIINWEYIGHPHSNKTDEEWQECFERLGMKLTRHIPLNDGIYNHIIYVLDT